MACSRLRSGTAGTGAVPGPRSLWRETAVLCLTDHTFLFGSEIKSSLRIQRIGRRSIKRRFSNTLRFKISLPTGRCSPESRFCRPVAICASLGSQKCGDVQRYWDYDFVEPEHPEDGREYLEELDRLFRQAVNRQLVSDVDVGAYLSGGMDSGSITAVAAAQLPYLKTFTCGFDLHSASGMEFSFDEREKAELMSYLFKTEHYEMVLKAGDMERILAAVHLASGGTSGRTELSELLCRTTGR